jgi:hypothetical protein
MHAHFIGFFTEILKECDILFHGHVGEGFFRGTHLPKRNIKLFGKNIFSVNEKIFDKNFVYSVLKKIKYSLYKYFPQQLFRKKLYY